jgi:hypothetical protein
MLSAVLLILVVSSLTFLCAVGKVSPSELVGVIVSLVGGFVAGKGISSNGGKKMLAIAALAPLATGCWMSGDQLKTSMDEVKDQVSTCLAKCASESAVKLMANQCNFQQALEEASDCAHKCSLLILPKGECKLEEISQIYDGSITLLVLQIPDTNQLHVGESPSAGQGLLNMLFGDSGQSCGSGRGVLVTGYGHGHGLFKSIYAHANPHLRFDGKNTLSESAEGVMQRLLRYLFIHGQGRMQEDNKRATIDYDARDQPPCALGVPQEARRRPLVHAKI